MTVSPPGATRHDDGTNFQQVARQSTQMNHRRVQSVRSGIDEAERPVQPPDSNTKAVAWATFATLMIVLGLWVARDFLVALTWAGLIAITAWPIYTRFATLLAGSRASVLAPLLFTILTGLVLLVPVALAMHQLAQGSDALARSLKQLQENGIPVPAWLAQLPIAGEYLDRWWRSNLGNPDVFVQWLRGANIESITAWVGALGGAVLHRLLLFLIALIALFLLLRDGTRLADHTLATAGRLLGHPGERLMRKIVDATRATVNGTLATSILKGAVIGIGYVLAEVPHPLLFTLLTIALAMVPFGAWVVLVAAALMVLHGGTLLAATGLFGFGAAVLLIGDNLVLPALIGGAAELPFLLVLIGIIGGIESFGVIGLFIGPVIMAVLLTMWREWTSAED
jgi:predicted PurR-regulated permease PerM